MKCEKKVLGPQKKTREVGQPSVPVWFRVLRCVSIDPVHVRLFTAV